MRKTIKYEFTDNFILKLADFIEDNYLKQNRDLSRLAFVFGGKRPALFLKRELALRQKKGFFSPSFFSVDEFVEYIFMKKYSRTKITDLDAGYLIYHLAKKISPGILKDRESFSRFLPWTREILNFIEQLDLEDIPVASLGNIQSKAQIGYDVPESINALLESVIALRQAYHRSLENSGAYSRGLMYLLASENINEISLNEFDQIHFCGLSYLYKTEDNIIDSLCAKDRAMVFIQEEEIGWAKPDFELTIEAGFDLHTQACLVRQRLKGTDGLDKTVVVLPVTENVIPVLSEISSSVGDFNVSMGYPLKRSSLYSLFSLLFKAQNSVKDGCYYTRDYLNVLSHPLVKNLKILPNPGVVRVLVHKIEEILLGMEATSLGGSLFFKLSDISGCRQLYDLAMQTVKSMDFEITYDELKSAVRQLHLLLFLSWEEIVNFAGFSCSLDEFLGVLAAKSSLGNYPLNLKMLDRIYAINDELMRSSFKDEPFVREDIFKIFIDKLESEMVAFSGSPLKGLQVLGLFETRSLNFERVVIMDMNEAGLPNLRIYEPLIPREVMVSLGLNRLEKEEEIQRYQFRRLIYGAKHVHLIYQDDPKKEKSRFIEELLWQRQIRENKLEVLPVLRGNFRVEVLPKRIEISKDAKILTFLKQHEYSASSINTYLHCPLRFYYQYVLGLKEKEVILDEPEGKDIGTFIHNLLETVFTPFLNKQPLINDKFCENFFCLLDEKFAEEFARKMKSDSFLIKEIMVFRLKQFLANEKKRAVAELLSLEDTFKGMIKFENGEFKFQARIDRIDRLSDGSILVLDYKTGGADILPQEAEKIEAAGLKRQVLKNTLKSIQLPLYLYFVGSQQKYFGQRINAALYSIKDMDKDFGLKALFKNEKQLAEKDKSLQIYLSALDALLGDILDPAVPFMADDDARQCEYCPFGYLCR